VTEIKNRIFGFLPLTWNVKLGKLGDLDKFDIVDSFCEQADTEVLDMGLGRRRSGKRKRVERLGDTSFFSQGPSDRMAVVWSSV
jgi:hypothetical protein